MTGGPGAGVLAVALAAAAGAVLPGQRDTVLRRVAASPAGRVARPAELPWWAPVPVVAFVVGWASRSVLLAAAAGVAGLAAGRAWSARAARRSAARRRAAAVDLVTTLAAELRGGAEPRVALAAAAGAAHPTVAAAARSPAADVPGALVAVDEDVGLLVGPGRGLAGRRADRRPAGRAGGAAGRGRAGRRGRAPRGGGTAGRSAGDGAAARGAAGLRRAARHRAGCGPRRLPAHDASRDRLCLLVGTLLVAAGVGWTEAIADRAERP